MRTAESGERRLALVGISTLTTELLRARLRAARQVSDLHGVWEGGAGSCHVVASVAGRVYARGTASGDRRLFHASSEGLTVVADRARTLSWLVGAEVEMRQVAVRLSSLVAPPHPLDEQSMFQGVEAVPPGHAVQVEPDGRRPLLHRWWRPPEPELPVRAAAADVRDALREALAARVRPGQVWGADLSGGMDSTSLCFLAAEAGAQLVALTLDWSSPGEDTAYARQAAALLPASTVHRTFPAVGLPSYYAGFTEGGEPEDEPLTHRRDMAQQQHMTAATREHGARGRICGQGGDQVVLPPLNHLHELAARHPLMAHRRLAGYAVKDRWSYRALARALADRRSYPSWLRSQAEALRPVRRGRRSGEGAASMLGWGPEVTMPPWATDHARDMTGDLLSEAAADVRPLAGTRCGHQWLYQVRQAGRIAAVYRTSGLEVEMPFCDDAVLAACLRTLPHEAGDPWSYKPLLTAAMDGIVPSPLLARTTKDFATAEWHSGMRVHRRQLAQWCDTSLLAAADLVHPETLRRAWLNTGLLPASQGPAAEATLAVESWLRDLAARPVPDYLKEHQRESPAAH
ncbi:asparagine synthase-related protein [Streptomyces spirodelae]|uniref:asparagine synthase (glutamine-hydrolyzing) n=1 Tax=Streptomyces spirodelae TaxID=2812904 RepID=A0ABS3WQ03_9ACTN|nr:asparagine synthase-related protein [Streptomyces spirodelae]MBO8185188.1 asparagine synthetase B family protein [Streptomyces spirodelae]